ncbi:MAG TPA: class I SAM-dependent methyltransferase [Pyrinomonadaceae bacterium]|nr:class I SAM-dependent methyltransferase [Pyrinomonadaceae bacterium]
MGIRNKLKDLFRDTLLYRKLGTRLSILKGRRYDRKHGIHTAPEVYLHELSIDSPHVKFGGNYSGTEPNYFRQIVSDLDIDVRDFTFIDFGSGMGRALFLASERPFKRIIGVEFARELHEIAENNIKNFRSPDQQCFQIEAVCTDATKFELPDGPLVCYFFDPFEKEVFEKVIRNLEEAIEQDSREIYVLYSNPQSNYLFEENPAFEQVDRGPWHTLHRLVAAVNSRYAWPFAAFTMMEHAIH